MVYKNVHDEWWRLRLDTDHQIEFLISGFTAAHWFMLEELCELFERQDVKVLEMVGWKDYLRIMKRKPIGCIETRIGGRCG